MPSPLHEAVSLLDEAKSIMGAMVAVMTLSISAKGLLMTLMPIVNFTNSGVTGLMK